MRLLLDDDSNRGSDSVSNTDRELFSDDYSSVNAGQEINPQTESYRSNNRSGGAPSDFEDSGYDSPNSGNYSDPDFQAAYKAKKRGSLIEQAKKGMKQGQAYAQRSIPKKIGGAMGDKDMFGDDSSKGREKAKKLAREKARKLATDKLGKKIGNEGLKKGFEKGLSKGASSLAKSGAKKAAQGAAKGAAKAGTKAATKGATAAVDLLGAATGVETFGLGFLLAFLLNIAISLGVNDAVDAVFELKSGDFKKAYFLAVRAASKIGIFIYILITLLSVASVAGIFIAVPLLVILNIYMIAGMVFKKNPTLQGMVWWEKIGLIVIDVFAFLILAAFLGALGWYLCTESGLGAGGVQGTAVGAIVSIYDWWNKTNAGSVAEDFCKYVQQSV